MCKPASCKTDRGSLRSACQSLVPGLCLTDSPLQEQLSVEITLRRKGARVRLASVT